MKNIKNIIRYGLISIFIIFQLSCDEQEYLKEKPLDFFSPENSFQNLENFQSAITDLYARVRQIHYGSENPIRFAHILGTDIAKNARGNADRMGDYNVHLVPTQTLVKFHWEQWYKIISNANTIISRINDSEIPEDGKKLILAEAKFFRAFAYRYLVHLYGGVPLILDEVTSPSTNYTRATKEEVLNQIILDATEAANSLPAINEVADGKVSNIVAQHLLAEIYISLNQLDKAIAAATAVIDDPETQLMTDRFGSRANEDPYDKFLKFTQPGDPYWDLFQAGNQNRGSGNREALWVAQMETDVVGGLITSSGTYANVLERYAAPIGWSLNDPEGGPGTLNTPFSDYNTGGRGVSFMMNTNHYLYTLWENNWDNDYRNAPHNIIRDFIYNNPNNTAWYDSSAVKYPSQFQQNQVWRWYPWPSKITTPGNHPDNLFENKDELTLKSSAGSTYRDMYLLRLAETYLLRAEAFWAKGEMQNAADDINKVRTRSNAKPVEPADVTLDYILDERARELVYEEQRRITLHRTGKLIERVRKYNDLNSDNIQDHHALWPIPFGEIEANKDAVIEQNPGYN